jgi:hypothetical protein
MFVDGFLGAFLECRRHKRSCRRFVLPALGALFGNDIDPRRITIASNFQSGRITGDPRIFFSAILP